MQRSEKIELKRGLKLKHITKKVEDPPIYIVCNHYIKTIKSFNQINLHFSNHVLKFFFTLNFASS